MSNFKYGRPKPLNWVEPTFHESETKTPSWDARINEHHRAGTPPTRQGSFHGKQSGLKPSIPDELNPPLILKAFGESFQAQFPGPDGQCLGR